ncbi:diguanylate cyclase domain-containing protein [Psychromonas sp.]|uniref:diguanylate cyclase domain-containing protein n=1 Tax=Psychromonas sp. TaxID=1884585 RepID=UPI0039E39642
MAQYNQTEDKISSDTLDFELENHEGDSKGVVDMAKYKQPEESVSAETSAFEQVMSQMNIADRRAFDNKYSQFWQEASDENELLSVLMCEIDFFKAYNDNYGHQGASFMLLVVGLALKNMCEKNGCFLARYKNEEFAILMKGGDQQKTLEVAESLRQAVESARTEHKYSSVSKIVTLSIGVSSIYPTSMKLLMKVADSALHDAKVSGRNQVCGNFSLNNSDRAAENSVATEQNSVTAEAKIAPEEKTIQTKETLQPVVSDLKQVMQDMDIADRSCFHHNFVKLWQESQDEKELLSMLMCEIDFFQAYVDHYGTPASEDVLIIVACELQRICEKYDCFVSHIEGEKFIILNKGGNATGALKVAEDLHKAVIKSATEHHHSGVSDVVTMSIGLSSIFPSDMNSMKMLMVEANTALHNATTSGRNMISVH